MRYAISHCAHHIEIPYPGLRVGGLVTIAQFYTTRTFVRIPEPREIRNKVWRPSYRNALGGFAGRMFRIYFPILYDRATWGPAIRHCAHHIEMFSRMANSIRLKHLFIWPILGGFTVWAPSALII